MHITFTERTLLNFVDAHESLYRLYVELRPGLRAVSARLKWDRNCYEPV